jgi:hypothetical protein
MGHPAAENGAAALVCITEEEGTEARVTWGKLGELECRLRSPIAAHVPSIRRRKYGYLATFAPQLCVSVANYVSEVDPGSDSI